MTTEDIHVLYTYRYTYRVIIKSWEDLKSLPVMQSPPLEKTQSCTLR